MLIVLILISTILIFLSLIDDGDLYIIPTGFLLIKIIALLFCINGIVNGRVIDEKIKLYEIQNKEIEEKIELSVKQYMNYEGEVLKDLKQDSYIQLVNLYPELKSDELIKQQINLYLENNNTIKKLKENKLNITVYKWWVYFGK